MELLSSLFASSGEYFISFFQNAHLIYILLAIIGVFLAILFGAFLLFFYRSRFLKLHWLWAILLFMILLIPMPWSLVLLIVITLIAIVFALRQPSFLKTHWLWAVLIPSAIITALAAAFIQLPLQVAIGKFFYANWTEEQLMRGILFTSLPTIFVSGFVLEGAKLLPVIAYWWSKDKKIDPKFGLIIGAVAGAGFGILGSQSFYNALFASGWTWDAISSLGFTALFPLFDGFLSIAFNIAMTALAGYGLAKGMGWQFYLIVSGVHSLVDYLNKLFQINLLNLVTVETSIAIVAIGSFVVTLWLLNRKDPLTKANSKETNR